MSTLNSCLCDFDIDFYLNDTKKALNKLCLFKRLLTKIAKHKCGKLKNHQKYISQQKDTSETFSTTFDHLAAA